MIKTETMSDVMLRALRNLIANDSYAATFQSTQQYRNALLGHFMDLVDTPGPEGTDLPSQRQAIPMFLRPQVRMCPLDGDQQTSVQVTALAKRGDA
ncbi:hypothetical protein [Massilia yuzhufengensis]|uniref:Uncharacterized protein n=1 Tax=Massilia yuzhufengensis TaxID=1164594 RepID=A0A1I1VML7_9BURK|nr:hypothetical protein [Massilia yuzhufengensis]SFD84322.1 hypothetical protein SAMN05216204_14053 [Massilia yuzhufengensis]